MNKLNFDNIQCRCADCIKKAVQLAERETGEKINYMMIEISDEHEERLRKRLGMQGSMETNEEKS